MENLACIVDEDFKGAVLFLDALCKALDRCRVRDVKLLKCYVARACRTSLSAVILMTISLKFENLYVCINRCISCYVMERCACSIPH